MVSKVDFVILAFSAVNSLRIAAYLPQLVSIMRDRTGAAAVACSTWVLFFVSNLTTVAYAIVVAEDARMAWIFSANTLCCAAIVAMTLWKRAALSGALDQIRGMAARLSVPDMHRAAVLVTAVTVAVACQLAYFR